MENVDWDLLKILNICARHKNFLEAALEAGVLPPAFSKQIKRLEQQVGEELFERINGNACNKFTQPCSNFECKFHNCTFAHDISEFNFSFHLCKFSSKCNNCF